ncbi:MAG TPA: NAD(P)-binding domain-containing protein [Candidatus Dormibacteraeota bacterium]|nr:NAD(P)-binding domain-containing protein [Candidatus Dormibacteraeota bacterium]
MSGQPWVAGVSAAERSAEERGELAAELALAARDGRGRVLLDTCHRVELYGFDEAPAAVAELPIKTGADAVSHLLRVAAGLESAVIGEEEVLHQVRDAFRAALTDRPLDFRSHRLFEVALSAGRRARSGRTASGAGLAGRAVDWLAARGPLAGRPVVVAGAGRMGSALAHEARKQGALVTIASRDAGRARRLAAVYEGTGVDLAEGARLAQSSVAVAIALSGPWQELDGLADPLPPIADISAPTAVPAALRSRLNGGFLGVDELFTGPGEPPAGYVEAAERIVAAKLEEYLGWLDARR